MYLEEFTKRQHDEFEYLDSIDLEPYLIEWDDVGDMMEKIQEEYGEGYYESFIFNCMNQDEFMVYLKNRYEDRIYFVEHTHYSIHLT